jgi:hypothetical protein
MRRAAVVVSGALALTGCGLQTPAQTPVGAPGSTAPAPAAAAGSTLAASAPPRGQPSSYNSALAGELLVVFATQYINWTSRTVVADMRTLASESVGQAHAAMELAAGETARDYELQRSGIANSGKVEAAAPLTNSGSRWVVVTLERTIATNSSAYQGLAPAWHVFVCALIRLAPGHWKVSLWQPVS